jgi:hypothetical protein
VEPIELGLRVQPEELDFGRVLEGATKTLPITLSSATRAELTVTLETDAPFGVMDSVVVPGGGEAPVNVTFRAGSERVEGVLRLTVEDRTAEVKLVGTGVRPPDCRPSGECIVSTYSLEEDRCIETQAADDAPCDPASVCLEQGRCRAGECLGVARRCDDNDQCTDDACAMDVGCVHTPHVCPMPALPCQVATCDPTSGCGQRAAPDQTLCGPIDCVEANFCFSGMCLTQPTPDGVPCSQPIACLPEATCQNQRCERVSEADWTPDWSARLVGEPTGEIQSSGATLFFSECFDAGVVDAGPFDAGLEDGGLDDAGVEDAGRPLVCGLTSYTGTGFERFVRAYEDDQPREVWAVNATGVLLSLDGGFELRSPTTGALRSAIELAVERAHVVVARDRVFAWVDGGVWAWVDGGLEPVAPLERPDSLARGNALFAWNADAGVLTRLELLSDGGVDRREHVVMGVETPVLSVVGDSVIFGGEARFHTASDAGLVRFDFSDAGFVQPIHPLTLASIVATNVTYERCDGGACELSVRVFDPSGTGLWDARLLDAGMVGRLMGATLVDALPGVFTAVVRTETPAGPRTSVALYGQGERLATCNLLPQSGAVELVHFSQGALVVTSRRPDGGLALESYGLQSLPVSRSGWPTPQGVGGTRSDRP